MNEAEKLIKNDEHLIEIQSLITDLRSKKTYFKDKSRLYCCVTFSVAIIIFILLFYAFDSLKYSETCKKSKKFLLEICDAPSLNFWTRFSVLFVSISLLVFSLYLSGPTIVSMDPNMNSIVIDKKKLFILPSQVEYKLNDLVEVFLDCTDSNLNKRNLTTFYFSSVVFVFKSESVSLSLGRDCFFVAKKIDLVNNINSYLNAIKYL